LFALAGILAWAGCHRTEHSATSPEPPTQEEAWKARGDALMAKVKPGMSASEVRDALGTPMKSFTALRGSDDVTTSWDYTVDTNITLRVLFDRNEKVTGAKLRSRFEIQ
jgi:outer membrane protein assembly factor BamE (lipoprotein component of BamABCDE complex)